MNLPKFEPLKIIFTNENSLNSEIKKLKNEIEVLRSFLEMEKNHSQHAKDIILNIVECESVQLPLPIVLEIFDYLHINEE
jgi:hypothetical protein